MKFKSWHPLLLGLVIAVAGLGSIRLSTAPYAPAVKAGYPDARTVVLVSQRPVFVIFSGLTLSFFALSFWLWKEIPRRPASSLNPPAAGGLP